MPNSSTRHSTLYPYIHKYFFFFVICCANKNISCNYTLAQTAQNINNNDVKKSLYERNEDKTDEIKKIIISSE